MIRKEKEQFVEKLKEELKHRKWIYLTDFSNLTTENMNLLRNKTRKSSIHFQVVKNRLLNLAVRDSELKDIAQFLDGPTGIFIGEDPIIASRIISDFRKENENLKIKGGLLEGKIYTGEGIEKLASIPPKEELLGKIVFLLNSPIQNFVGTLEKIIIRFILTVDMIKNIKKE